VEAPVIETTRTAELNGADAGLRRLAAGGLPLDSAARRPGTGTSARTVRRRITSVCGRLGCASSIKAVAGAARRGPA
jgi:hypothetical protein